MENEILMDDKNILVMKLLHYFIMIKTIILLSYKGLKMKFG